MRTPKSFLASALGLMILLLETTKILAPASSASTTTGGVNVIVGETTQPDRITLLRAGSYEYQTSGALTQVFEVSMNSVEVNIFSTASTKGSEVTVNIAPTLISRISGTNVIVASIAGEQIHINPGIRTTKTGMLAYNAGGELNSPALDIDFHFWFRGQTKSITLDGSYLKVNLNGIRFGAPSIGGKLSMNGPFSPDSIPQGLTHFSYQ